MKKLLLLCLMSMCLTFCGKKPIWVDLPHWFNTKNISAKNIITISNDGTIHNNESDKYEVIFDLSKNEVLLNYSIFKSIDFNGSDSANHQECIKSQNHDLKDLFAAANLLEYNIKDPNADILACYNEVLTNFEFDDKTHSSSSSCGNGILPLIENSSFDVFFDLAKSITQDLFESCGSDTGLKKL